MLVSVFICTKVVLVCTDDFLYTPMELRMLCIVLRKQCTVLGTQCASALLRFRCLSPRSAYFYEFPPNDQNYTNTAKKRTTFSRFLRGLKTSHRKEKHGASSPRHGRAAARGVPQRVSFEF
ncbi:hypothetical protein JTB14_000535 [Gonioctena quinquepunctata]|nr:hypothetical protein JTB14_000535 [Gonioctena quinquepunctata]